MGQRLGNGQADAGATEGAFARLARRGGIAQCIDQQVGEDLDEARRISEILRGVKTLEAPER